MAHDPHDGGVCLHCGQDTNLLNRVEELCEENQSLKDRIGKLEVACKRLKGQTDSQLPSHPKYSDAVEVLQYWRDRCKPGAKQVTSGPRVKLVIACLSGKDAYSVEDLKRAVDGYAAFPFVVPGAGEWRRPAGREDQWRADATLIFRDTDHVEQGFKLAFRANMHRNALPSEPSSNGHSNGHVKVVSEPKPSLDLGTIGNRALELVRHPQRFHVFPCVPNGKMPATERGLLNAKTGEAGEFAVKQFWSNHPDANIGLRTGRESGIIVLDVDDRKGGLEQLHDLEKKFAPLPLTFRVKTPGGGTHYYFAHSGAEIRNTTDIPRPGIDIRGDGGYVLAPPSQVDGRFYEVDEEGPFAPMPDWLESRLIARQLRQSNGPIDPAEFERIVTQGVAKGARNDQLLSLAGHLWSKRLQPGEVLGLVQSVNVSRCRPPLPDSEVAKIVGSVQTMRKRQQVQR